MKQKQREEVNSGQDMFILCQKPLLTSLFAFSNDSQNTRRS
jgi:hypothetical protein